MAKLKYGLFGPLSGKIGNIIGGTWKGIPYVREVPVPSNQPRSAARLANEAKFKYVNDWLVPFQPYLNVGFQNLAIQKTALAAALSANYKTVFTGMFPDIQVAYDQLLISSGPLSSLGYPHATLSAPDVLSLSWQQNGLSQSSYSDQVFLVLYSPDLHLTDGFIGAASRAAERFDFKFSPELIGQALEVYIGVTTLDRKQVSNSQYLGRITP